MKHIFSFEIIYLWSVDDILPYNTRRDPPQNNRPRRSKLSRY